MHVVKYLLSVGARFVVVSRHPGELVWVAAGLDGDYLPDVNLITVPDGKGGIYLLTVITGNATEDDVRDAHVIGNIPLSLASKAQRVFAIEFGGNPPRGQEYTAHDMTAAAARLSGYSVTRHYSHW